MNARQPHLLFATSLLPDPTGVTGYDIANRAIVDGLRRLGMRVTLVGFSRDGAAHERDAIVLGKLDPTTRTASRGDKLRWLYRAFAASLPIGCAKLLEISADAMQAALDRAGRADLIIVNAAQIGGAFETVFMHHDFLYVAHNVEHVSASENAAAAASIVLRALYRREARLLRAIERRLTGAAEYVLTLSDEDRMALGVPGNHRSAMLPLVTRDHPVAPLPERRPQWDAVLIGTWTWQPNLLGLCWFLDHVVPLLPATLSIRIAGTVPEGFAAHYPRAEFVGRIEDATAFLRQGRVVPLVSTAGTGVQLKTIEVFELGLPTVATRHALRGIETPPENCIIADEPAAFARALERSARPPERPDIDGTLFHARQRAGLDRALAKALKRCGLILEDDRR